MGTLISKLKIRVVNKNKPSNQGNGKFTPFATGSGTGSPRPYYTGDSLGSNASNTSGSLEVATKVRHLKTRYNVSPNALGHGQFGMVREVIDKRTNEKFACKSIDKIRKNRPCDIAALKREVDMLKLFKGHDCIAGFHDVLEDKKEVHIIMELCTGGELFKKIVTKKKFTEYEVAFMMRSILQTVALCHDHYIIHSDLKPENFILSHEGPGARLKAIDFGVSQFCDEGEYLADLVGSIKYMAPEVFKRQYNYKADIWSCGVILYLLISNEMPFYGANPREISRAVCNWDPELTFGRWLEVSDQCKSIVKQMLNRDFNERPSARDVLNSDWMKFHRLNPKEPLKNAILLKLEQFSQCNLLKKAALKFIASKLEPCQTEGLRRIFKQLDSDTTDTISAEELFQAMVAKKEHVSLKEMKYLVSQIDINGSGRIDYTEFLAANMRLGQLDSQENIELAFREFDADRNNYITADEVESVLNQYMVQDYNVDEIMKMVDIDCDQMICFQEFRAMIKGSC